MRLLFSILLLSFAFTGISCNSKDSRQQNSLTENISLQNTPVKPADIQDFLEKHPKFKSYASQIDSIYKQNRYDYVWFYNNNLNEFAYSLYNKIEHWNEDGIENDFPYKEEADSLLKGSQADASPQADITFTGLYLAYANKVITGISPEKAHEIGWELTRKTYPYYDKLQAFLSNPELINKPENNILGQYFKLKKALKNYREIEKNGGWKTISFPNPKTVFNPGDSDKTIAQVRERLFVTKDIKQDSKSEKYDVSLIDAVQNYKRRHAMNPGPGIDQRLINSMNVPVAQRIQSIEVNMERCRWVSPDIIKANTFIIINIPSFRLTFFRNGKPELVSKVVVGKAMNQTVVFGGDMNQIVFSPYWNIPKSILEKEIKPELAKNPNYLAQHNMEWHNGRLRQKPGPKNSLGLVKFLFPNSNNIYLHDTPSKSLFDKEERAFSHGCIRVAKPKELAEAVLKNDPYWTSEKIDAAMKSGKEKFYRIKNTIPVHIGYFTAWVGQGDNVNFYNDIYERDATLAKLLKED